jgi:uncharacterized repeat protein (TIGR03803 family)
MTRLVNALSKLHCGKRACAAFALCATTMALPAQTFTTLHSFDGQDGELPHAGLVQASDWNLYGATVGGGADSRGGTIFKIAPNGALTTLYSFCSQSGCADGAYPYAGLVQARSGELYGTTTGGGTNQRGTVFKIALNGGLTTLHSFCSQTGCTDGEYPAGTLVEASNGDLYGTTSGGGANDSSGTVFKITPSGALTTLYSFCSLSGCTDGKSPTAGLVQAVDGDFYGTTETGGANCRNGCGTVFKITLSGALTTLHSFCSGTDCRDGAAPVAGLIQAYDGNFYGTTLEGGEHALGTIFKITPGGTLTTLHSFCSQTGCPDGSYPNGGLVQAIDGDLYGTTTFGGACALASGCGTIFKITPSGALTTLHDFCSQSECTDGDIPDAALVQGADGNFFGTTNFGGASIGGCSSGNGCGTVFSLSGGWDR